jgi:hypothetical protein
MLDFNRTVTFKHMQAQAYEDAASTPCTRCHPVPASACYGFTGRIDVVTPAMPLTTQLCNNCLDSQQFSFSSSSWKQGVLILLPLKALYAIQCKRKQCPAMGSVLCLFFFRISSSPRLHPAHVVASEAALLISIFHAPMEWKSLVHGR